MLMYSFKMFFEYGRLIDVEKVAHELFCVDGLLPVILCVYKDGKCFLLHILFL